MAKGSVKINARDFLRLVAKAPITREGFIRKAFLAIGAKFTKTMTNERLTGPKSPPNVMGPLAVGDTGRLLASLGFRIVGKDIKMLALLISIGGPLAPYAIIQEDGLGVPPRLQFVKTWEKQQQKNVRVLNKAIELAVARLNQ